MKYNQEDNKKDIKFGVIFITIWLILNFIAIAYIYNIVQDFKERLP